MKNRYRKYIGWTLHLAGVVALVILSADIKDEAERLESRSENFDKLHTLYDQLATGTENYEQIIESPKPMYREIECEEKMFKGLRSERSIQMNYWLCLGVLVISAIGYGMTHTKEKNEHTTTSDRK